MTSQSSRIRVNLVKKLKRELDPPKKVNGNDPLSGIVEIDESMIGGKREGKRGRGAGGKTTLLGMMERHGRVVVKKLPDLKVGSIYPAIQKNVERGSEVHTDRLPAYSGLRYEGYDHKAVNHGAGQYVSGNCHVNSIEGYWFHLQKAIRGTHIWVSSKHLEKYAGEFAFRFNLRQTPEVMFPALVSSFSPLK